MGLRAFRTRKCRGHDGWQGYHVCYDGHLDVLLGSRDDRLIFNALTI